MLPTHVAQPRPNTGQVLSDFRKASRSSQIAATRTLGSRTRAYADQPTVKQWLGLRSVVPRQPGMDHSTRREQADPWVPDLDLQASKIAFRVFDGEAEYVLVFAVVNGWVEGGLGWADPQDAGSTFQRFAAAAMSIVRAVAPEASTAAVFSLAIISLGVLLGASACHREE
jgi:hypothetical protein